MPRLALRVAVPLLLAACPADETPLSTMSSETTAADESSGGTPTEGVDVSTASMPEASSSGEATTADESTGPIAPPICGNGFVEGDEPCDDGNDEPDDGCTTKCERTGVPLWTLSWDSGAKEDDSGWTVVLDADGNIYVAGTVERADQFSDGVVRKLDAEGNELATYEYAGQLGLDDGGRGLAVGADGSVFLGGYEAIVEGGSEQAYVRKFAADGAVMWTYIQQSMYVDGYSAIFAVAVDGDAIFVAGSEETADKVYETYVHRLDPDDGQPVWTNHIDAVGFNAQGLAIAPGGDLLLASSGVDPGDDPVPFVARYAPADGDEVWMRTFEEVGYARGVAVNADGDIAVTGWILSSLGDADYWTARLTSEGDVVWSVDHDQDQKDDVGSAIAWSATGDLYTGGWVYVAAQQNNAYVRRLTGDGEVYWHSSYNDPSDLYDSVVGLAVGADRVIVVGTEFVSGSGSNQWIRAYMP